MKLYQTPGGTWAGSEKDWKAAMKAEGSDPKDADRKIVEVPTAKAALMEFLTFHNVNVINPRAFNEPDRSDTPPVEPAASSGSTTVTDLDEAFAAAPVRQQLRLSVTAIDAALEQL